MSHPKPATPSDKRTRGAPRATVIMRCKNSDWVIDQAIAALFSQDYEDFELIVVDSGSTDRTLDIVRQYPCELIEIEAAQYLPGAVLNMAAERARGELLVFQNSDTVPLHHGSLRRLVDEFDDPAVHAAFARQVPRPEAHSWVRRDYACAFPPRGDAPPWLTLSLPFAAMRKSTWRKHPFYTEAWASEDTEWGRWANDHHLEIRYVPEATVMHSHNYTLREIYGRRFVEGEADAFIYEEDDQWMSLLLRTASSIIRDVRYALGRGDVLGAAASPARRSVYQWAYYQGKKFGAQRRRSGNSDIAAGQEIVLARHDAAKPRTRNLQGQEQ